MSDKPPAQEDCGKVNNSLTIGASAPHFLARTTMGERSLNDYRGGWLLLFSHPADFTPVCTSEFVAFAKSYEEFKTLNCELLGLSIDSLPSHLAWMRNIQSEFGVQIPFPVAEDPSMNIASAYGMLQPEATNSATVRATFIIDPLGIIRAIVWYPMNVGRNISELLRLVTALQVSDEHDVYTPEGWMPGDDVIEMPPQDMSSVSSKESASGDWYYKLRKL